MVSTVLTVRRVLALVLSLLLMVMWVPNLLTSTAFAATIDGFEIDGDLVAGAGNLDWGNVLTQPTVSDGVGNNEDSVFQTSSKESSSPADWTLGTSNTDPKDDIGGVYAYTKTTLTPTPNVTQFFGWDRTDGSGTDFYVVELNQKSPTRNTADTLDVPNRTVGDLRFNVHDQGSGGLAFEEVDKWSATGWHCFYGPTGQGASPYGSGPCDNNISAASSAFNYAINVTFNAQNKPTGFPVDVPDNWTKTSPNAIGATATDNGTLAPETFVEMSFDLSALGLVPDCPSPGFGSAMLRDITGNSHENLKDYISPFPINVPSTCAKLVIKKWNADKSALLGGATFTVAPNPATGSGSISVTDGGNNDADNTADGVITFASAKPGSYTVTETSPPPGYTLPPANAKIVTLTAASTQTVTFEFQDYLGSLSWQKVDATNQHLVGGATFVVHRTDNDGKPVAQQDGVVQPDVTVIDKYGANAGQNDSDSDAGEFTVAGLKTGHYTITETAAPTGYDLPALADRSQTATITDVYADRDVSLSTAFSDPHKTSTLTVKKVDGDNANAALAGATFQLWQETNGVDGLQRSGGTPDTLIGNCSTTLPTGTCSISGLDFGDYYWYEATAPTGYNVPANAVSSKIPISAANAGGTFAVTTFTDSQILSSLSVKKVDAEHTNIVLSGAHFRLWKESGAQTGLQTTGANADTQITNSDCVTDVSGLCSVGSLMFGTYYWVETQAPAGYTLPANAVSAGQVVDANNAGGNPVTTVQFEDPQQLSTLRVEKVDADHPATHLAGAVFELWKESGTTTGLQRTGNDADTQVEANCVTNANGFCSVGSLHFGQYYWREITAPAGYNLPAQTVQGPITLDAAHSGGTDPVFTTTFSDPEKISSLRVEKTDATTGAHLSGAVFQLWLESNSSQDLQTGAGGDTFVNSCTTDQTGFCTIGSLKFGSYYWRELTAPTGYDLPAQTVQGPRVIDATNAGGDPVFTNSFADPQKTSTLRVKKVDADTGDVLAGGVFTLWKESGAQNGLQTSGANADTTAGNCTTQANGFCSISGLHFGDYYWQETAAPTGYDLPAQTVQGPVTLDATHSGGTDPIATNTFRDPETRSQLTVKKIDGTTEEALAGVTFKLWQESGVTAGLQTSGADADTAIGTCDTTLPDGTCSIGSLLFGTYYWQETAAPTGYTLPDPDHTGPIVIDAAHAGTTFTTPVFVDPQILTSLSVQKLDATTGLPLAGAQFTLRKQVGASQAPATDPAVGSPCTTDNTGICTATGLHFGKYYWYEEAAPAGYSLPATRTTQTVTVTAANAGSVLPTQQIRDPQVVSSLRVHKADDVTQGDVSGATFQLWLESNQAPGLQRTGTADTLVDSCTTNGNGACSIGALNFGTYYWYESGVPAGYDAPANRTSLPIVIDASDAGGDPVSTTPFSDPQTPSQLTVEKLDDTTSAPLSDVVFDLYVDDNGTNGLQTGAAGDTKVGSCTTQANGKCTIGDLHFGDYYWVEHAAPTGYTLPDPAVQGPISITRDNAGGDFALTVFRDPQILSTLSVLKLDQQTQTPLPGAHFTLKRQLGAVQAPATDNSAGSCVTGVDGTCSVEGLHFGTYYWVETQAPNGYNLPADTTSDSVVVDASNAGTELPVRSFSDPELLTDLTVEKIDGQTQAQLSGAHFTLWQESNGTPGLQTTGDPADTSAGSCVTGVVGTCTVSELVFGTYYWQETQAPTGYDLPDVTISDAIVINADNAGTILGNTVFSDPEKTTSLTVEKVDESTQSVLAGASFSLWRESDGVVGLQTGAEGDTLVDSCVTLNSGTCSIGGLLFGTYYWQETQAPAGYQLPDTTVSDAIVLDADNAGSVLAASVFADPELPTTLTVQKVEGGSNTPLAGGHFDLWRETNAVEGLQTTGESTDTKVGSCMTNAGGTCSVQNLLFGIYYWVETAPPTGYQMPDNPVSDAVVVNADNAGSTDIVTSFSDAQVLSELFVKKVDAETGVALSGATFELWQESNDQQGLQTDGESADTKVGECTTGADGTCSASDLPFGTYYWRETAAPAGYLLPDSPVSDPIVIGADVAGTDLPVTVFNDTPTGSLSITKEVDKATAKFGDTLTYTLHLHAVGPQLQSNVTVTDFVPGYDPADTASWKVTYINGSASCSVTCTTAYDAGSHLLTWKLTNPIPEPSDVDLTFKATIDTPPADANGGLPAETIFNTAVVTSNHTPPTRSNKVKTVVVAVLGEKVVRPEPAPLPFTGPTVPPQMASVVALLLIGTGIVLTAVRRRREEG